MGGKNYMRAIFRIHWAKYFICINFLQRELIPFVHFLSFYFQRQTTFETSCLLFQIPIPFGKGSILKGKNLLQTSKFFPFRGNKKHLNIAPLQMYPFSLQQGAEMLYPNRNYQALRNQNFIYLPGKQQLLKKKY